MQSKHIAIPRSEIERHVMEDWLRDQMTKDVAKQGWCADVKMNFDGMATVIWAIAHDYIWLGHDCSVVLGIAWLDTQRNVACWECNATGDLPPQSNDVGFGPVLPRVEKNSGAKGESLGTGSN